MYFLAVLAFIGNAKDTNAVSSSLIQGGGHCRDYNGKLYETGMHYMPGPDSCRLCICDSGLPKACKMVLCEAFSKCKSFQTVGSGNNCCERKMRARENRQNAEDQRSIVGSIGASVSSAAAATASSLAYAVARRTPRGSQELLQQQPQQQYLTVADVEINASASSASYHTLPASSAELQQQQQQQLQQQLQQQQLQQQQQQQLIAAALSTPAIDMLPPLEIAPSTTDSVTQTMPIKSQHQPQQQQQQQQVGSKTPSSTRRYQRSMPRYYAVADPLQMVPSVKVKSSGSSNSSSTDATASSSSTKLSKKPMCQCPIQHVPMSYMGSNANANTNAFLSGAGKLFTSSGNACALSPRHATTLAYGQRIKSSSSLSPQQPSDLQRNASAHEPKIATISKQVGDELQSHATPASNSVSAIIPPPPLQHHDEVNAPPIVLGRVQKRSSGSSAAERARSTSGGRSAASAEMLTNAYLNRKVDAYLSLTQKQPQHYYNQQQQTTLLQSEQINPILPPKLYKSLTNLKSATVTAATTTAAATTSNYNNNNAVATIYTLSKSSNNSVNLQRKEQAPTLTLPPASPSASCSEKSSAKINSSTFYPLANHHVTYTLPKHISGKVSLNSTINSVVSKVPSVISIPPLENNNEKLAIQSKSTTLPKILRVKSTAAGASSAASSSSSSNTTATTTIAMPSYPQQSVRSANSTPSKQLPVCTTSKNCLNPKEHFLPNDTSLDDDYLSECENCKIAQSAKYYLDANLTVSNAAAATPQETMTLQRKSLEETKEETHDSYYRSSHTLPSNAKKLGASKNNNREAWQFSTIPAASSSDEDINE
ncbi:CG42404 [Drosophila busckii]|uniref:CG42404 n=1 Tax=Drosophila busckii TaxID=30019 RepID=A0A0M4F7B8_DROBS|nr:CG42404 [Drosophila busckii]